MTKSLTSRFSRGLLLALVCVIAGILGLALGARSPAAAASPVSLPPQSDEKSIEISERPDELVEFRTLRLNDVEIAPNRKFSASALAAKSGGQVVDWIQNLQFSLRNRTDKRITYIGFELQFPDTGATGPLMVYREFGIGIHPNAGTPAGAVLRNDVPLSLGPGETATAILSADRLRRIKHFIGLRNFQLADLSRVVVKVLNVFFDDGVMWSTGHYYKPNIAAPGGYERIDR